MLLPFQGAFFLAIYTQGVALGFMLVGLSARLPPFPVLVGLSARLPPFPVLVGLSVHLPLCLLGF